MDLIGNKIERALTAIGITDKRIERWVGSCGGCPQRKAKLNRLHSWALRVLSGKTLNAKEHFEQILEE